MTLLFTVERIDTLVLHLVIHSSWLLVLTHFVQSTSFSELRLARVNQRGTIDRRKDTSVRFINPSYSR